jgi:hypothetical protein
VDYELSKEEQDFRAEVEEFCKKEMPSGWLQKSMFWPGGWGTFPCHEEGAEEWSKEFVLRLGKKGWLKCLWPKEYGGMNSAVKQAILYDVLHYYRLPDGDIGAFIVGPTLLQAASEEMKKEWLPKVASGEASFWLGYSEPNAGSDLAALTMKAVDDGDYLIVNGQKTWSSGAHMTDYAWLVARTDLTATKHRGISLMIVDMKTPGITVRPLMNICGYHSFNEVFFDDVRVPKKNIVGQIHQGFFYLMIALQFERMIAWTGAFRRTFEELTAYVKKGSRFGKPMKDDPAVQSKLADIAIEIDVLLGAYWRTAWMIDQGQIPEMDASGTKLHATELSRKFANAAIDILGLSGQLYKGDKHAPLNGRVAVGYMDSISGPIGAGSSEIQRSIIATRGLGMPRK